MQYPIELATLDISGTTVKDKGEIMETFEKTFQQRDLDFIIGSRQESPVSL